MDEPTPPDRPRRAPSRRPRDMILSLLVLLVPIVLLIGGYQLISGRTDPVVVDPAPAVAEARAAGLVVTEPAGLAPAWVPVSAAFAEGGVLRVGYLTPAGDSAQLIQTTLAPGELLRDPDPRGEVEVAGRTWQRYATRPGEQALVLAGPDQTTVVIGTADESELRDLATAVS